MPPWDLAVQAPDIAVLVVLKEEFAELKRELSQRWFARENPTYAGYDYFWIDPVGGYRCVATFAGRMGTEEAAHASDRLLEFKPAVIVNIGIAAPDLVVAYAKTTKIRPKPTGRKSL